jgi:hypothetical protein
MEQALAQGNSQDVTLPEGYVWYETMIVLRHDMSDEERRGLPHFSSAFQVHSLCSYPRAACQANL